MSGLIVIRTEVINDKLEEFFNAMSPWTIGIAKIYKFKETTEIIYNVELLGYGEPDLVYEDVKDYVTDVWHCVVGDVELKPGKDCKGYNWESCKKNYEANKEEEEK